MHPLHDRDPAEWEADHGMVAATLRRLGAGAGTAASRLPRDDPSHPGSVVGPGPPARDSHRAAPAALLDLRHQRAVGCRAEGDDLVAAPQARRAAGSLPPGPLVLLRPGPPVGPVRTAGRCRWPGLSPGQGRLPGKYRADGVHRPRSRVLPGRRAAALGAGPYRRAAARRGGGGGAVYRLLPVARPAGTAAPPLPLPPLVGAR